MFAVMIVEVLPTHRGRGEVEQQRDPDGTSLVEVADDLAMVSAYEPRCEVGDLLQRRRPEIVVEVRRERRTMPLELGGVSLRTEKISVDAEWQERLPGTRHEAPDDRRADSGLDAASTGSHADTTDDLDSA